MSLDPLAQLNILVIAAVIVIWIATFAILRRVLLLPLLAVMDRRQKKLDAAAAIENDARALLERARQEAARIGDEARVAAERAAKDASDELIRTREAKLAEANRQAQDIAARGRDEIATLRASEEAKLAAQLLDCARQALLKLTPEVDDVALKVIVASALAGERR